MAIIPNFTKDDIRRRLEAFNAEIQRQQISLMQEVGEICVTRARSVPKEQGFEDQTGNLRSSIGYTIFVDGIAVHAQYEQVLAGSEGAKIGQALAEKIGSSTKGVCLVVTAGMNYAVYVEAKGRDVITGAEHLAANILPSMLQDLIPGIKSVAQ